MRTDAGELLGAYREQPRSPPENGIRQAAARVAQQRPPGDLFEERMAQADLQEMLVGKYTTPKRRRRAWLFLALPFTLIGILGLCWQLPALFAGQTAGAFLQTLGMCALWTAMAAYFPILLLTHRRYTFH
ncbi:hypothetical protein [Luteimonas aquatica]|uniref:hypothetical protein n=1 Tax=Luteimonas aquatica TaxID=450364 RepID=UPI001F59C90E|nr:hypothetical protein [Luteimonas aquatica]